MLDEGGGHFYSLRPRLIPHIDYADFDRRLARVFGLLAERSAAYLDASDPQLRRRLLWRSHAGVPFWDKWAAVPGALMLYLLRREQGPAAVARLIAEQPFSLPLAYDRLAADRPDWPRLPPRLVAAARRCLRQHRRARLSSDRGPADGAGSRSRAATRAR